MTDQEMTDKEGGVAGPNAAPLAKRPMVSVMYAYAKVADTRADIKTRAAGQATAELEAGENAKDEIIQRLYNLNKDCRDLLDKREKDYADLLLYCFSGMITCFRLAVIQTRRALRRTRTGTPSSACRLGLW